MSDASPRPTLEQVIAGFVQACETGEPLARETLLQSHPEYRQELEEFLDSNEELVALAQSARQAHSSLRNDSSIIPGSRKSADSSTSFSMSLHPPKIFGDYAILEEIDRGGMGVVYKATHIHLGRTVALKLIRSGELASDEEIQRFRSEAEAAAALSHPGIVPIYEVGMLHGLVYYTMAYIEGESLAEVVARGGLSPQDAMRIIHKLCVSVEYAHSHGVYHRDLKPANVLLEASGQPIIIDFGLAKFANRDSSLTSVGQILGTPAYMAPEQALGKKTIGPGTDVYSLGAMLYCLCAGQPPFTGPTPFDVLLQVLDRDPPKPSRLNRRVSPELDFVCHKALEKNPGLRYQSAAELAEDLQRIVRGEPLDRPRERIAERLESWWRREPILAAHVYGIGATTLIVATSNVIRGQESPFFPYRMTLLLMWFLTSYGLQSWVVKARWRDTACLTWATVDVAFYTSLVAFADSPRLILLVGYPMLIAASGLFYRKRFVLYMTGLCTIGFLILAVFVPRNDFVRVDFCAIFLCGLFVICSILLAMIRRVRGMSDFYENERL